MAYSYPRDIPTWLKNLPVGAQKLGIHVFNKVLKSSDGDETAARKASWGAIKYRYKKLKVGKWRRKKRTKAEMLVDLKGMISWYEDRARNKRAAGDRQRESLVYFRSHR